jgi:hypothetical protein
MSMIITVCGRKFRCVARSAVLQEVSEEVRQHLHAPSVPIWDQRLARLRKRVRHRWRQGADCLSNGYAAVRLALVRATLAARPVVQFALGL